MMKNFSTVLHLCELICFLLSLADADYTVRVDLENYQNPSHMRAQSNDLCDGEHDPCDNRFRFCYSDTVDQAEAIGILNVRPEEAVIGCQFATGLVAMDNDNITFPSNGIFGENTRNPLTFTGDVWPGIGYLLVIVFDVDSSTIDDGVDAILVSILPSSLRRFSRVEEYSGVFGYGKLTARYRVDCQDGFFGEDCSVFCSARDDADGHFECDRDGNRVCLEGFRNASTDCTECVPAAGCSPVGGYCSLPGNCICLPGFSGDNCTEIEEVEDAVPAPSFRGTQTSVVVLGALVGGLAVVLLLLILVVFILIVCIRRRGKVIPANERLSRSYYMNEGLGPTTTPIDLDEDNDRTSRQYATVTALDRNHDSTSPPAVSASRSDVPNSSLRVNVAYGIEQKNQRERGLVNGLRVPMRPPPRPPR